MLKHGKGVLYLLFALSGFCALVYEILWTRYLSLSFGTTIYAVSIVAATFMGGLALGSFLLGKYADHQSNLLRIYAYLELAIAITALLFPPTLQLVESAYVFLSKAYPGNTLLTHSLHFAFSALLLIPPTACMGGTFPLMCRFFARKKSGGQIGRLYALNTLGATGGALLAGYLLIPNLGLSTTGYLMIAINFLIFIAAYRFSGQIGQTETTDVSKSKRPELPRLAGVHQATLSAIAMIGLLSLAYEILWTRVFLLFLGNTTYAFSLILSAYLVGIALGGVLYSRMAHPAIDEHRIFLQLTIVMGLAILVTIPFYDQLARLFLFTHQTSGERWWHLSLLSYLLVFVVMSIPTIISGALLPAAVAILDPGKTRTGEGVGLVVLHNTGGAVLGSLLAGFVLIPFFGLQGSFRFLACINLYLGFYLYLRHRPTGRLRFAFPTLIVAGLLLASFPLTWDPAPMNSGVYIYAPKYLQMGGLDKILGLERILAVIEGSETTVAVHESLDGETRFFTVNGKTDGGTGRDMSTQTLVGQLPMLLHPAPRDVLVIGLGTGVTLRGMGDHPTKQIDCVEISAEVIQAYDYFKETTGDPLRHPKVKLLQDDGRNLLVTTSKSYDVIVSEPSNPWQTGNANLFTADFYRLAAEHLNPNGLFCQWIGLYDITPDNLRILGNTFLQTFPHALVFKAGTDLILVGARHELYFDYSELRRRMALPGVKEVLAAVEISSPGDLVAMHYLYSEEPLLELSQKAGLNTDDRPVLEFSARHNLGEHTMGEFQQANMTLLTSAQSKVYLPMVNLGRNPQELSAALRDLGNGYAKIGRQKEAENFLLKAEEVEAQGRSGGPALSRQEIETPEEAPPRS
jgi:spermidine synthase